MQSIILYVAGISISNAIFFTQTYAISIKDIRNFINLDVHDLVFVCAI